ncbi:MAG: hypothetical protein IPJ77_24245 [Planctomycetes bacterium]|nr:hypothetical protein [Planctomycetota bacterium]
MTRRSTWLLLALLLATRALLVLVAADIHGYGEELGKGAAAKAILDHLPVEHWRLAYVYHEGGGFVITHLRALAYSLVGPTLLANKLVAFTTTALLLLATLRTARAHFGDRAAWCFGLAFVFAPEAFLRFSMLSLGTHFEACLFFVLVAHFTLRIAASPAPTTRDFLGLGFTAGFGLYFSLLTLASIVWSTLALLVFARHELSPRRIAVALSGAVLGLLPLFWMMSHVGLDALFVRAKEGGASAKIPRWAALQDVFGALERGDPGAWVLAIAYTLLLGLGVVLVRTNPDVLRRRRVALVALVAPVFLALYLASGMAIPRDNWFFFLRLSPVWVFGTLTAAACADELFARGTKAKGACASFAVAALVGVGVYDLAGLASRGWWNPSFVAYQTAHVKGYDYAEYFDKVQHHLEGTVEDKIAVLRRYDDDPALLLPAISLSLFEHADVSLEEAIAISKRSHGEQWKVALTGLRFFVHPRNAGYDLAAAFAAIETVDTEARAPLAEAVGRAGLGPRFVPAKIAKQLEFAPPDDLVVPFLRGTGWRIYRAFGLRRDLAREFLAAQAPRGVGELLAGIQLAEGADWHPSIGATRP